MSHFNERELMPEPEFMTLDFGKLLNKSSQRGETDRFARAIDKGIQTYNEILVERGDPYQNLIDEKTTRWLRMFILGAIN